MIKKIAHKISLWDDSGKLISFAKNLTEKQANTANETKKIFGLQVHRLEVF